MSLWTGLRGLVFWNQQEQELIDEEGDSPLVQKFSHVRRIRVGEQNATVRTFVMPHHKGHKLPNLPLVMFIHGLGGQLTQFEPLIDYFAHFATVISMDLPGHGKSPVSTNWQCYEPEFLVNLLHALLQASRPDSEGREVVLIGHSMGSVLAARLAKKLGSRCIGVIAICPPAKIDPKIEQNKKWLGYLPTVLFDLFRSFDRIGGIHSKSVSRMMSPNATDDMRMKQFRWNLQVKTNGWMRMAYCFRPASADEWRGINCPLYLVGGSDDQVCPPDDHCSQIITWLSDLGALEEYFESTIISDAGHAVMVEKPEIVCGKIGDFIYHHVDNKLSLSWQLAFLAAQMDKWSLKNEAKWRRTQSVGDKVGPFRGMKTLRQEDPVHSPALLEKNYPDIAHIIDISRESPPYEPLSFRRIKHHKFPTVSKIPPTRKEVDEFTELVDQCLKENENDKGAVVVGVHCHYGFNRTGFFIVSYLISRLGYSVPDAIAAFQKSRDPGIKHPHFIDELYMRYAT